MKRYILSTILAILATSLLAMSYSRASEEALYLTDKMAYELNLNDQQYNDAYEINLDYFLSLNSESDLYGNYLSYRLTDIRHILYDWQYEMMLGYDFFVRPIVWRSGGWFFPIYAHYDRHHLYYGRPSIYYSYRGGHGRNYYSGGNYYANRRPAWNGGMRGHEPVGRPNTHGYSHEIGDRPNRGTNYSGINHNRPNGTHDRPNGTHDRPNGSYGRPETGNSRYEGNHRRPNTNETKSQERTNTNRGDYGQHSRPGSNYDGRRGQSFDNSSSRTTIERMQSNPSSRSSNYNRPSQTTISPSRGSMNYGGSRGATFGGGHSSGNMGGIRGGGRR